MNIIINITINMKKFQTRLFAIALEKKRADKYSLLLENKRKRKETSENGEKVRFETHKSISRKTGVNEATVRNCFVAKYDIGINGLLALCEWANLNINDFYK